jgi:PAS domain S-box-containing protein
MIDVVNTYSSPSDSLASLVREVLTHHILEVSSDPMFLVNADERIVVANRAVERQLGWSDGQLIGRRFDDIVAEYDSAAPHIVSSNVSASVPGVGVARGAKLRRVDGTLDGVQLVTYRLRLDSCAIPEIVIAQRRCAMRSAA